MSYNIAETRDTSPSLSEALMPQTQQTLLFPSLLKQADQHRRLSVLEIGLALPDTVDFFSRYRCRVFFAAMYSDPVMDLQSGDISEAQLVDHFRESFNFPDGLRFDLCLFWDFLNYLDDKAFRAFNTAIRPYLHDTTRAHAFTVRTMQTRIPNQRYGVSREDLFSVRQAPTPQRPCYPHTQPILVNLLTCFDIDQGMLLPDGRTEVVMTAGNKNAEKRPITPLKRSDYRKMFN